MDPWTPGPRRARSCGQDLGESLVAYFAALLARTEDGWDVSETELDDVETLADLADLAREAAEDEDDDEDAAVDPDGVPTGPLGDAGLLIEFGVGAKELMDMSVEGSVPGDALTEIADALGVGDVLEAVR